MNLRTLILASIFAVAPVIGAQEVEEVNTQAPQVERYQPEVSTTRYLAAHLVTTGLFTALAGDVACNALRSDEPIKLTLGLAALLAVAYKIPQWTDYLLGIKKDRHIGENVCSFLTKAVLPYPFGTLFGELIVAKNYHC